MTSPPPSTANKSGFQKQRTPEFIAAARALWDMGLPTAEIGRRLHVTKNVIIGVAHRNGFPARRIVQSTVRTFVQRALGVSTTRAAAVATLMDMLPSQVWRHPSARAALYSWLRDDAALGVTITRRWPAGV